MRKNWKQKPITISTRPTESVGTHIAWVAAGGLASHRGIVGTGPNPGAAINDLMCLIKIGEGA